MCLPSQLSRAHYPLLALLFLLSCTILASYLPPLKCNSHPTHLPKEFNNPIPKTFFPSNKTHPTLLDEAHLTRNGGFLMLRKTPSAPPIGYGISMLHQAHCVDMLRAALFGGPHEHTLHFRRDTPRAVDSLDDEHLEHCLDYIAQGILCAADDTIEPRVVDWERKVAVINGVDVVHRCRDSRFVRDVVERSRGEPVLVEREVGVGETLGSLLSGGLV